MLGSSWAKLPVNLPYLIEVIVAREMASNIRDLLAERIQYLVLSEEIIEGRVFVIFKMSNVIEKRYARE